MQWTIISQCTLLQAIINGQPRAMPMGDQQIVNCWPVPVPVLLLLLPRIAIINGNTNVNDDSVLQQK